MADSARLANRPTPSGSGSKSYSTSAAAAMMAVFMILNVGVFL